MGFLSLPLASCGSPNCLHPKMEATNTIFQWGFPFLEGKPGSYRR